AITRRVAVRVQTMRRLGSGFATHWHRLTGHAQDSFARRTDRIFALNMQVVRRKFAMNFLMNLTHHLGIAGVLLAGGWFVGQGAIEVGTVVAFLSGLARVNDPWGDLVNYFRELTLADTKYGLVRSVFETPTGEAVERAAASVARLSAATAPGQ